MASAPVIDEAWLAMQRIGGLETARDELEAALAVLRAGGAAAAVVAGRLVRGKVAALAVHNLASAAVSDRMGRELQGQLAEHVRDADSWRLEAWPHVRLVLELAARCGGRLMKGLATGRRYPDPGLRHLGDVDVHFPTLDAALPFLRELRAAGWEWDPLEVPWIKWDESGIPYGQWAAARDVGRAVPVRVDAHVGAYSTGHLGLLPVLGFEDGCVDGVRLPCTEAETSLAVLAAHAETEGRLSFKDVNDACVLARSGPIDWQSTHELCRAAGVERALEQLMARVEAAYGIRAAWTAPSVGSVTPARSGGPGRALRMVRLTHRQERRRRSAFHAGLRLAGCLAYFSADLRHARWTAARRDPCPGCCRGPSGRAWARRCPRRPACGGSSG